MCKCTYISNDIKKLGLSLLHEEKFLLHKKKRWQIEKIVKNPSSGLTVDFGEVKTAPTECKEKCYQIMPSA